MAARDGMQLLEGLKSSGETVRAQWNLTPEEVHSLYKAIIQHSTAVCDDIAKAVDNPTWANTMGAMAEDDTLFCISENMCSFPSHVSADKALRDAASEADKALSEYAVAASSRYDVYQAIVAYSETEHAKSLTGEAKRYLDRTLRSYRRKGMHLEEDKRNKVEALNKRMSELGIQFSKNLGEVTTKLHFTDKELEGLPDDFLNSKEKTEDGKYIVSLKYPDLFPIMKLCKVESTRKAMDIASNSTCKEENTAILEELVRLRNKAAQLLGYKTHAQFVTEIRMAKSPEAVMTFLQDLSVKLTPLQDQEMAKFLDLKKQEKAARGEEFDGKIHTWDMQYYRNKVVETEYNVDDEKIKQYFPLQVVTKGLLDIYQEMLGLRFEEDEALEAAAWHPEVKAYKVFDSESKDLLGVFYMDMHPRDGKYGHAACFTIQPGCSSTLSPSGRILPVAACVCNFPKPTAEKPALLSHSDVETFFHEFGHVMHVLCSKTEFCMFSGTRVERDFVEAPSQMLENWVWEDEALQRMSGHYADTSKTLPRDLLEPLAKSRIANAGVLNKRQLVFALFDQYIHTQPEADTAKEYARILKEVMGLEAPEGTNFAATFGHIAGGYDAQYYGYLWAEVFAQDMFDSKFKAAGIFSKDVGLQYRSQILQPGGSRDGHDSLVAFLGREPTMEPFLKSKGLAVA